MSPNEAHLNIYMTQAPYSEEIVKVDARRSRIVARFILNFDLMIRHPSIQTVRNKQNSKEYMPFQPNNQSSDLIIVLKGKFTAIDL